MTPFRVLVRCNETHLGIKSWLNLTSTPLHGLQPLRLRCQLLRIFTPYAGLSLPSPLRSTASPSTVHTNDLHPSMDLLAPAGASSGILEQFSAIALISRTIGSLIITVGYRLPKFFIQCEDNAFANDIMRSHRTNWTKRPGDSLARNPYAHECCPVSIHAQHGTISQLDLSQAKITSSA
jgi:hypothetical protein